MDKITEILKDIPSYDGLRERLIEQEARILVLEAQLDKKDARIAELEAKVADFEAHQQKVKEQASICPHCHQHKGQLLLLVPDKIFGFPEIKRGFYKCGNCGKVYDKQNNP